jgi:glycosyltransferase involved in cell wall biosynthesis
MASTKPRVSIGLPIYNAEKYLEEAIDSILAQTYTDLELIISDNASTDRTQEICLRYAQNDQRIRYYRNDSNLGGAPNHNIVFRLAKGEYFKWAAYDDKLAPDFLLKCVEVLDKHPDVVLCMSQTDLIDEHGKHLRHFDYKEANADLPNPTKRFRNFLLHNLSANFFYGLIRVNRMAQTSLHGNFTAADVVLQAELALYGRFRVVPEYLFFRRDHPEQSTKGVWKSERARAAWFDTALAGKIVLPKWRFLFSCLQAVHRAPLNLYERLTCYAYVFRWTLWRRNIWALGKDIAVAAQLLIVRSFLKRRLPLIEKSESKV